MTRFAIPLLVCAMVAASGCNTAEKPASTEAGSQTAVPADVQAVADTLLGQGSEVLAVGELAHNGHRQALVVNRLANAPPSGLGVPVTRAAVLEENRGKWSEVLRCDEYLKNPKGFLGGSSHAPTEGWRLQLRQNGKSKSQEFDFTPLQAQGDTPAATIIVRWNPKVGRYQSVDPSSGKFLDELLELEIPRSELH